MSRPQRPRWQRPTDLELMRFADGELPADRRATVEAWARHDAAARAKLAGMKTVGGLVRERVAARPPVNVAGDVMAAVRRGRALDAPTRWTPRRAAGRRVFLTAATVFAAAAALLVWAHGDAGRPGHAASAEATARVGGQAPAPREHGVEVWSVEFGERPGAVVYVPSETSPSDTITVVWLASEEPADDGLADDPGADGAP